MVKEPEISSLEAGELVARVQAGDREALNQLMQRIYPLVHRIVRVRMGSRLRLHLESGDIVQEAFIPVIKTIERFEYSDRGRFVNWLARIVEHQIGDAVDRMSADKRGDGKVQSLEAMSRDAEHENEPPIPAQVSDPSDHAATMEQTTFVDHCLAQCEEKLREAIVLRDLAGASWQYVTEQLGLPNQAAARELHRKARGKLARMMRNGQ